jgi:hypothetical protein
MSTQQTAKLDTRLAEARTMAEQAHLQHPLLAPIHAIASSAIK